MNDTHKDACRLDEPCCYLVKVRGEVRLEELNPASPLKLDSCGAAGPNTALWLRADQSGLVGLLRFLHSRGLVILTVCRGEPFAGQEMK
jgi:hypothetical protein